MPKREILSEADRRELMEFTMQDESELQEFPDPMDVVYEDSIDMNTPLPNHLQQSINARVNRKRAKAAYKRNLGKQIGKEVNMRLKIAEERAEGYRDHNF